MRFWKRLTAHRDDAQPLPAEIYISLVDALFKDSRSLYVGSLAASITALITAWKTGEQALYLCTVAIVIVTCMRALDVQAYAKRRPFLTTSRGGAAMGAALRRRRGRPRLADGHLVPGGLRQDIRPVRPDLLLLPDDRLHDRHLRAQLREQPAGDGADRLRGYSDDAGAGLGRRRLLHDLRLRAGAVLRHREVHLRPAAPRPARCGRGQPRREPAGGALRHRAQQHAARAVHVRRRPPRRGVEQAAGRAARRVARHCRQPACRRASSSWPAWRRERCRARTPSVWCRSSRAALPARSTASCSSRPSAAARSPSPSTPWPTAAASCCSRTSPTARWPRPRSTSSPATIP